MSGTGRGFPNFSTWQDELLDKKREVDVQSGQSLESTPAALRASEVVSRASSGLEEQASERAGVQTCAPKHKAC